MFNLLARLLKLFLGKAHPFSSHLAMLVMRNLSAVHHLNSYRTSLLCFSNLISPCHVEETI